MAAIRTDASPSTKTPGGGGEPASPWKPRLLWRGSLVLADGTALPGVAFVSTSQPYFASSPSAAVPASKPLQAGEMASGAAAVGSDVSTAMTREQEAELSLSVEMVRHKPLPIVDVVSSTCDYDDPNSRLTFTYQMANGMRAYIDPGCHATVAYFERIFCYPISETSHAAHSSALVLSLESASFHLSSPAAEAASSPGMQSSDPFSSSFTSATTQSTLSTLQGRATQLAIMGRAKTVAEKTTLELVLGQKVIKRVPRRAQSSTTSSISNKRLGDEGWPLRPDDPAPRTSSSLAQVLTAKTKTGRRAESASRAASTSHTSLALGPPLPPPPLPMRAKTEGGTVARRPSLTKLSSSSASVPSKRKLHKSASASDVGGSLQDTERQSQSPEIVLKRSNTGGNHTPGRRGEKRPKREDSFTLLPTLDHDDSDDGGEDGVNDEAEWQMPLSPSADRGGIRVKKERSESVGPLETPSRSVTPLPAPPQKAEGNGEKQQQRNRATIKKLVHHQLLGKGIERHDREYRTCFTPTCTGTALALRNELAQAPLDRARAAAIVAAHLDMYLISPVDRSTMTTTSAAAASSTSGGTLDE